MGVLTACGIAPASWPTDTGLLTTSISRVYLFTGTTITKCHAGWLKPQQCIVSQF